MSARLSGYMSEIEYTHGYYFELSPLHATQALRLAGFSRIAGRGRKYLELGYGQGLAANIHAAATDLEIWRADFNSSHAAHAREVAAEAETGAILFDDSFAELPGEIQLTFTGARGEAQLDAAIYTPLIEMLARDGMRTKAVGELEAAIASRGVAFLQVVEAVKVLLGKGDLFFVQDAAVATATALNTRRLNRCLMERAGGSGDIAFLASPVTGGGVPVMRFEQLFLQAREDVLATPVDWATSLLGCSSC